MSTPSSSQQKIVLQSSDGEVFEIEEVAALKSETIKNMIEDDCASTTIPLPNVSSKTLAKIIEYCQHHAKEGCGNGHKEFDSDFIDVDQTTLFDLILAANYLNIKSLLDLGCVTVANMIKEKSVEEIRRIFNIKNDFTPEEEEEVRKENAWAFE